jgi:multicomponent Na+:H+ antiporter subunit B
MKLLAFVGILCMSGILFITTVGLPQIYNPHSAPSEHVSPRYIEKSTEETGSPNFVTAVLADYRGYDTLGETTVIFTAGLATVLLLRSARSRGTPSFREEQTCSVKGDPDE